MEWFCELSIINQLIEYKDINKALNDTKRISSWEKWNEMIDWKGLTINIYSEVTQLKLVSKLHANTSSPDVYC